MRRLSSILPALVALVLLAVACGGGGNAGNPQAAQSQAASPAPGAGTRTGGGLSGSLVGAGATFPEPLYQKWIQDYTKIQPGVSINYQGVGSGAGVTQFTAKSTDFGASDAFMKDAEIATAEQNCGCKVLHVPTVFGAVVMAYNLPELKSLTLDGPTLANIFLGKITKYNDPAIAALNPRATLPDREIRVAHRSDASGTTSIFTTYLASVSPAWESGPGAGKEIQWPAGQGGQGNDGVAALVKQNEGAMGYVEFSYALSNKLPAVTMRNKDGNAVKPALESTAAAAQSLQIPDDLRFNVLGVGGQGYPIVGATWILVRSRGYDTAKADALKGFLTWALHNGDADARQLGYAPTPDSLRQKALAKVAMITGG
jgi:phosphate transport system substrate-binding protein